MTVDDSIKCRFANSGVTDQVGGFQNPGVCLQAFPSFLPHPLPALLLAPLFSRSLTLVPRSFLRNRTETLATQATVWRPKSNYLKGAKSGRKRVVQEMITGSLSLPFSLFPARPPFRAPFTFAPSSLSESLEQVMKVSVAACGNVLLPEFNNKETSYIKWRYPANAAVIPRLKNINILRQKRLELSRYFGRTSRSSSGDWDFMKNRNVVTI